ncbi:rhodanese-related sulfurtransferase [Oscillatoria sp. CS-180]|uniref:oxygen-dependent tRNA uridine(34) hydroxylase TrhO n=1 Tax=Oscillatoria sp. CS-180 TaxID=3021720 RepID=UPI00232B3929|nr:rhodanese-related sulfurtransferase [Oscillatoria sp. CS-180]MDB9528711.1 rhodanese-related sulfurtransferase [Oscillatoria sp. CS-180]
MTVVVATFYKFVAVENCEDLRRSLQALCDDYAIRGTILLAPEGLNATVSGLRDNISQILAILKADPRFTDLTVKFSTAEHHPFGRMKVKIKPEIVTLGQPDIDPTQHVGTYVNPAEWNELIVDPDVVLVDARNDYEVNIGTFHGAINPQTEAFRRLPDYLTTHLNPQQHKKVAMFCTGGIRCEKATAYLLKQGFREVYHLKGGILKYLEEVPETESLWEGECFVFDERVAVRHGLEPGSYDLCYACGHPISETDKATSYYEPGIACPHCYHELTPEKRSKQEMKKFQHDQKRGHSL